MSPAPQRAGDIDAVEIVRRIRDGDMRAETYVADLLRRTQEHSRLNAIITIDADRVLGEARAIDEARAQGRRLGALAGLPFVIKDQIDVAGYPTTMGHSALRGHVAKRNAAVVDTLLELGAVVLAKTNCGPMIGGFPARPLSAATNNNPYFGPVRNPYDSTRMSGGSSGGNAACLAAGLAPAGLGEDTGGSIRIPSAFCGVAGLRPSTYSMANAIAGSRRKRYSDAGIVPPAGLYETIGPMARSVADVAFIDSALTGHALPKVELTRARIGVPRADYWEAGPFEPGVHAVIANAFDKLRDKGAKLCEVDLISIMKAAMAAPLPIARPENGLAHWLEENVPGITLDDINRLPRRTRPATGAISGHPAPAPAASANMNEILGGVLRQYEAMFEPQYLDAIAFPCQMMPAPAINIHGDLPGQELEVNGIWVDEFELILRNTLWGAKLGAPSLNIPAGLASGLPVGLLLQGIAGDDSKLLAIGVEVEKVLGRIPPPG